VVALIDSKEVHQEDLEAAAEESADLLKLQVEVVIHLQQLQLKELTVAEVQAHQETGAEPEAAAEELLKVVVVLLVHMILEMVEKELEQQ
jgi:hypothetical protein